MLIQLNQRNKKATSEEFTPAFTFLLLAIKLFLIFSPICISKKYLFNKVFNIDYQPLVKDYIGKEVDLNFVDC